MYIRPLRNPKLAILPPDRVDQFISDVFHNFDELHAHHRRLVDTLHEIQREEHPKLRSITAAVFDAALNFREAYLEYIPNYPIAAYRIDHEMANNPGFKTFVEVIAEHIHVRTYVYNLSTAMCAAPGCSSSRHEELRQSPDTSPPSVRTSTEGYP